MSNRLKNETSPYLLQHSGNPVNWFPWCTEAFEKAKSENKPIFLSIGYSTCHWCHVMAHESFENLQTAEILNNNFISIKVDREERPDIDSVYMSVCQAITGSGGWPMCIFMTWDKKPFFAGTYFPVRSKYGVPGFVDLLNAISDQWENNRKELLESADNIISHLKASERMNKGIKEHNLEEMAVGHLEKSFDEAYGGFGSAPKFPMPHDLLFLMLFAKTANDPNALKMAEKTLIQMRKGGIFDHIGYGFSRYSTDRYFLVPHFEKMLYDNALLIIAYAAAYSITQNKFYLDTAEKTAGYILHEMTSSDGGFYSAQDADSEGVEGRFYTFSQKEIFDVLGMEKGKMFAKTFDITAAGNFEGVNIPNLLKSNDLSIDLGSEIHKIYDYRKNRAALHLDDKILISWNSIAIAALSFLYRVTKNAKYLSAAEKAQKFIENNLCEDLQLYTSFRNGNHSDNSVLDDYAFYISALIELYNSTLENDYLIKAEHFCSETIQKFYDFDNGGFYLSKKENDELFMNPKETYDGALPSGNSVMAYNLARLSQITESEKYSDLINKQFAFMSSKAQEHPSGHCMFLLSKLMYENPPEHITIVLKDKKDLQSIKANLPVFANITVVDENSDYRLINNQTTYYICKNNVCGAPVNKMDLL